MGDKYKTHLDAAELTVVGIILTPDISAVDGSSEHVTNNLDGTVDMDGTAGGDNALS